MAKQHLGDWVIPKEIFKGADRYLKEFRSKAFQARVEPQKQEQISGAIFELIQKSDREGFLLPPVLDFIDKVNAAKSVEHYTFSHFELWLNQFSGLSFEENQKIRGKLVGKWIPREAYQLLFPIGTGKVYPGSHYVTAHGSPDLDTTVASFWGWVDAFAARVGENLHIWNVPGGAPASQVEVDLLFYQIFSPNIFHHVAKHRTSLTVSSLDLLSQQRVVTKQMGESTFGIGEPEDAILLVDAQGCYKGEWRHNDVERVRYVITLLNQCLRWFENNLHVQLISLFAKTNLSRKDLAKFTRSIFDMRIKECEPAEEFTEKQKELIQVYLAKVLGVSKGLGSTFEEFAKAMKALSLFDFQEFVDLVEAMETSKLFSKAGKLQENRSAIFEYLNKIIQGLDKAIYSIRRFVERLDVALKVKSVVLGMEPQHISHRADLEELRSKMDGHPYLTVTSSDEKGRLFPLGVVHAAELYKTTLGTVTLRDFCNRDETKIPSYLEIISVIDHHKSHMVTTAPATVLITDAQSSNTLVAEKSFELNDNHSLGGMALREIEAQIKELQRKLSSPSNQRIFQRLLQRLLVAKKKGGFFVAPDREATEYLHFLYAILDDTDLLTKTSPRDLEVVASILNRLKSLMLGKEVEVIHFDDIPRDRNFAKRAAQRILQNEDMYSLYRKIYRAKEDAVSENLTLCIAGKPSTVFADTKEQNGCCRAGQTKIFASNFKIYDKHAKGLQHLWWTQAQSVFKEKPEVDLHLHMVSTVAGADELYSGKENPYKHQDELWIWIPNTDPATEHLKNFLNALRHAPHVVNNRMDVEFCGENGKELEQIFADSFIKIPTKRTKKGLPLAILRFRAGTMNSRKAMISPYLPKL